MSTSEIWHDKINWSAPAGLTAPAKKTAWQLDIRRTMASAWETVARKGSAAACKSEARKWHLVNNRANPFVWYRLYDVQGRLVEVSCDNEHWRMVWGPGNLKPRGRQTRVSLGASLA